MAYVGKGNVGIVRPGRIQVVDDAGLYILNGGKQTLLKNESFYLADNDNYTYYWTQKVDGTLLPNSVLVLPDKGALFWTIARVQINGHWQITYEIGGRAVFPNSQGGIDFYEDYELLVCDTIPKYQCGELKKTFLVNF